MGRVLCNDGFSVQFDCAKQQSTRLRKMDYVMSGASGGCKYNSRSMNRCFVLYPPVPA